MAISVYSRGPQHVLIKGRNGAGAIPLPGARGSDQIVGVFNNGTGVNESASFETSVSVAGQIQQTSGSNLSGNEYWCVSIG
jgi:hypothetical protein